MTDIYDRIRQHLYSGQFADAACFDEFVANNPQRSQVLRLVTEFELDMAANGLAIWLGSPFASSTKPTLACLRIIGCTSLADELERVLEVVFGEQFDTYLQELRRSQDFRSELYEKTDGVSAVSKFDSFFSAQHETLLQKLVDYLDATKNEI